MTPPPRRSPAGAVGLGVTATVVYTLPVFLTGALVVDLTDELAFGATALGVAVATNRLTAAALSPYLGRLTDRLGATRSIRLAALIAAVTSFGIAATAHRWITLVVWLMVHGYVNALGQPAANRMLSNAVRPDRLGMAFGIKQSAPPTASMLAGLSVPAIALTLGWRWAYVLAGVAALLVVLAASWKPPPAPSRSTDGARRMTVDHPRVVRLLAVAFGLGTATSSALTTFYVDAAVRSGVAQQFAGTMLAVASAAAISVRLLAGLASDRIPDGHLRICAALATFGAVGIAMLAAGDPRLVAVGGVVALAGTWGFGGVFWFAIVRAYPLTPGRVTGMVMPGVLLGATAGPILFGAIAEHISYGAAWSVGGVVALVAAATMLYGANQLARVRMPTG